MSAVVLCHKLNGSLSWEQLANSCCTLNTSKCSRLRRPIDKLRTLLGQLLALRSVGVELQNDTQLQLQYGPAGRPLLTAPSAPIPNIDVSVSHHGAWVAAGQVTGEGATIGVDIMSVGDAPSAIALDSYYAGYVSTDEMDAFRRYLALSTTEGDTVYRRLFCALWTVKEAYVKVR